MKYCINESETRGFYCPGLEGRSTR